MTLPSERTRAVLWTEDFLQKLCNPKKTPRVPTSVRYEASLLLRHYPSRYDMEIVAEREEKVDSFWAPQIFGRIE